MPSTFYTFLLSKYIYLSSFQQKCQCQLLVIFVFLSLKYSKKGISAFNELKVFVVSWISENFSKFVETWKITWSLKFWNLGLPASRAAWVVLTWGRLGVSESLECNKNRVHSSTREQTNGECLNIPKTTVLIIEIIDKGLERTQRWMWGIAIELVRHVFTGQQTY